MDGYICTSSELQRRETILAIPETQDTTARIAVTPELMREAAKVRYDGYLSYGYIEAHRDKLFTDGYDAAANSRTVVIYRDYRPAATIRVTLLDLDGRWPSADKVPSMDIFGAEILALGETAMRAGRSGRIVEINRFASAPSFANDRTLIIAAFRMVAYLRLYFDADLMINAVRTQHMPMYRRLGFKKIEEPRQYPNLNFSTGLMAMFPEQYETALQKIGFPDGVSVSDPIYTRLIAGESVPAFSSSWSNPRPPEVPNATITIGG
ncbi:N-acyl amino acid synthase FeeM domain-containing protein [Acidiphilium sp. C61]|jgi:hypothetical protein|uniref:N-acyl amino acid synthase FeeM domain-containing protein n=1 Tax=Acidiphilium sp. C61 TaxID=1671485 RepID=UPI00157A2E90|nr:hypothetical protein [Acidiphilium sp. C61]